MDSSFQVYVMSLTPSSSLLPAQPFLYLTCPSPFNIFTPALTSTSLPGFGITTVLADYAATLLYIFRLVSLYPSEIMTTSATRFMKWWRRTWRQEKRMKRRQEKERYVEDRKKSG